MARARHRLDLAAQTVRRPLFAAWAWGDDQGGPAGVLLRHRTRIALIVWSASIQLQWRGEMRDKFGRITRPSQAKTRRSAVVHVAAVVICRDLSQCRHPGTDRKTLSQIAG